MEHDLKYGQIVQSKAGRDKGRFMIVVGFSDSDFVLLADGKVRKIANPKRKKIKHIARTNRFSEEIASILSTHENLLDAQIRDCLEQYNHKFDNRK